MEAELETMPYQHTMMDDIEEVSKIEGVRVAFVNFETERIIMALPSDKAGHQEILDRITFFDATERIQVVSADFTSGEITIKFLPKGMTKILSLTSAYFTKKEVELILTGNRIAAIKLVRGRTNCGLKEALNAVDRYKQLHKGSKFTS